MSISVNFYTFSKETNSTCRPGGDPVTFMCRLLEPVSLTTPTIVLNEEDPHKFNYVHIPKFGRYYFVTEWLYNAGLWSAYLAVDVLASWKTEIGASSQYISRSSGDFDGNIVDVKYPTKTDPVVTVQTGENPFKPFLEQGCYIIGVINSDNNSVGSVSYYQLSNSQFATLRHALMGDTNWLFEGVEETLVQLGKYQLNPYQYIVSCKWYPFASFGVSSELSGLPYGWFNVPSVSCSRLAADVLHSVEFDFDLPKHPQAAERGEYLNAAPYTRVCLDWPVIGRMPLDPNRLVEAEKINVVVTVDPVSGGATVRLSAVIGERGELLHTSTAMIGVPIQLAQMSTDFLGMAKTVASSVDSFRKFDIGGGIEGIADAVTAALPQLSTGGSNGSISAYHYSPRLIVEHYEVVEEDRAHIGRPLMERRTISTMAGYMECMGAHIEIPATSVENDKIKMFMTGGFYYE